MTFKSTRLVLALSALLFAAGAGTCLAEDFGSVFAALNGPTYSMEGAWHGTATVDGTDIVTPTLDTFTWDARRGPGIQGSFLCTIPPGKLPNPTNPEGLLTLTASGHGNWVRVGKNKYSFTAYRTIFDENGKLFGIQKNWGTITPVSDNEYTGTIKVVFVMADGTPFTPVFTGTLHSERIPIIPEQ